MTQFERSEDWDAGPEASSSLSFVVFDCRSSERYSPVGDRVEDQVTGHSFCPGDMTASRNVGADTTGAEAADDGVSCASEAEPASAITMMEASFFMATYFPLVPDAAGSPGLGAALLPAALAEAAAASADTLAATLAAVAEVLASAALAAL